jgi:hypothetical protein
MVIEARNARERFALVLPPAGQVACAHGPM